MVWFINKNNIVGTYMYMYIYAPHVKAGISTEQLLAFTEGPLPGDYMYWVVRTVRTIVHNKNNFGHVQFSLAFIVTFLLLTSHTINGLLNMFLQNS